MKLDPTARALFTSVIEKSINTALQYDPGTRHRLDKLQGKQLALHCQTPDIDLFFYILDKTFYVMSESDHTSDVALSGKLMDIVNLVVKGEKSLSDSGVTVSGKISVLTDYQDAFKHLDIDWEEPLHQLLGNVAGQAVAQTISELGLWGKAVLSNGRDQVPIILKEELKLIPHEVELETFYENVEQLQSDVNRVSAKIQRLRQRVESQ